MSRAESARRRRSMACFGRRLTAGTARIEPADRWRHTASRRQRRLQSRAQPPAEAGRGALCPAPAPESLPQPARCHPAGSTMITTSPPKNMPDILSSPLDSIFHIKCMPHVPSLEIYCILGNLQQTSVVLQMEALIHFYEALVLRAGGERRRAECSVISQAICPHYVASTYSLNSRGYVKC